MNRGHVLDLTNYHFKRELGDVLVFGTWIGDTMDDSEPCLAIVPRRRIGYTKAKPACIALSAAYRYDDPAYLLVAAMEFNKGLGFEDNMGRVHKLADIIHSHLQDLIEMPPRPTRQSIVAADAFVTDRNTGKTFEAEVSEDV